jgi:hypothetical protein
MKEYFDKVIQPELDILDELLGTKHIAVTVENEQDWDFVWIEHANGRKTMAVF